jgi:hypothetical protein
MESPEQTFKEYSDEWLKLYEVLCWAPDGTPAYSEDDMRQIMRFARDAWERGYLDAQADAANKVLL